MTTNSMPVEITPAEVKRRIDAGERLFLVDVREPYEHQQSNIAAARLIPMRTVPGNLQDIEGMSDEGAVVVFCHHGMRSMQVVNWLREQGVQNCTSMAGGIDRWSSEVDPSVPRYY
jgi:rhodanese-related sulfurtransferase